MKADASFKLFGNRIVFSVGEEKKTGRLVQVRIDPNERLLVGIDENGFVEEYEIGDVRILETFKSGQAALTKQIIRHVDLEINSFKYDLLEYYKEEIFNSLNEITDKSVKKYIIQCLDGGSEDHASLNGLYSKIRECVSDENKAGLLCGLIAFKQGDIDTAYRIFSGRWLDSKGSPDCCRDFILVADEFDNDVLCFYLLNRFFLNNSRYAYERYYYNLWWKYLFYAVKYNNFKLLENMSISEMNVRILIDSFIYIFHMYNLDHVAERLTNCFTGRNDAVLQQNNEDLDNVQAAIDELNLCRNYLPNTAEGYYLRFESCINRILSAYENNNVTINDDRAGYIYEYVKSRNYGFIVGFDFQKYFYHKNDLTPNLIKRITENIYSNKNIEEEEKIYVQFRMERTNKKIHAVDII